MMLNHSSDHPGLLKASGRLARPEIRLDVNQYLTRVYLHAEQDTLAPLYWRVHYDHGQVAENHYKVSMIHFCLHPETGALYSLSLICLWNYQIISQSHLLYAGTSQAGQQGVPCFELGPWKNKENTLVFVDAVLLPQLILGSDFARIVLLANQPLEKHLASGPLHFYFNAEDELIAIDLTGLSSLEVENLRSCLN